MRNINFRTALEQFPEAKRGESRAFLNSFRSRESLGKHQIDLKISGTASWNTRDARKPAELRNSFLKHNRFWRQLGSKSFLKHLIQFNNRTELNIVAFWNAQKGHENSPENLTSNLKMYGQYVRNNRDGRTLLKCLRIPAWPCSQNAKNAGTQSQERVPISAQ